MRPARRRASSGGRRPGAPRTPKYAASRSSLDQALTDAMRAAFAAQRAEIGPLWL